MNIPGLPSRQGLYNPTLEPDLCEWPLLTPSSVKWTGKAPRSI